MTLAPALNGNGKWKTRLVIGLVLIGPLYVAPCLLRSLLSGWGGYALGVVLGDAFGCLVAGFLTNNYRFGAWLYVAATGFEMVVLFGGHEPRTALWIGDLVPALVVIYFAQQLFVNMGD